MVMDCLGERKRGSDIEGVLIGEGPEVKEEVVEEKQILVTRIGSLEVKGWRLSQAKAWYCPPTNGVGCFGFQRVRVRHHISR